MGVVDIASLLRLAILADFELAFDASNRNAKSNDAGQQGAAKALGKIVPLFGIGRFVLRDQAFEQGFFARLIFDQFA